MLNVEYFTFSVPDSPVEPGRPEEGQKPANRK